MHRAEERSTVALRIVTAGALAGIAANATGYAITGRWFHPYQARTPATWRPGESWKHYQYATLIRIGACLAVACLYAVLARAVPSFATGALARGASFGALLWGAAIVPLVLEVSLFVNWHRGFVVGLLLDWLVVCLLASIAAALALGPL